MEGECAREREGAMLRECVGRDVGERAEETEEKAAFRGGLRLSRCPETGVPQPLLQNALGNADTTRDAALGAVNRTVRPALARNFDAAVCHSAPRRAATRDLGLFADIYVMSFERGKLRLDDVSYVAFHFDEVSARFYDTCLAHIFARIPFKTAGGYLCIELFYQ